MTIRASDRAASERFYETVLATLGIEKTNANAEFAEWDDFSVAAASADRPATRRLHIGFAAPSRTHVDEFWRTGTAAGYATKARRARARSTARITTARSCSTRTGTAPRRCATAL